MSICPPSTDRAQEHLCCVYKQMGSLYFLLCKQNFHLSVIKISVLQNNLNDTFVHDYHWWLSEQLVSVYLTKPFPKLSIMVRMFFIIIKQPTVWITWQPVRGQYLSVWLVDGTRRTSSIHVSFASKSNAWCTSRFRPGRSVWAKAERH